MGPLYYDWTGNPIDLATWARLFQDDRSLAQSVVGDVRVSTVWLGLDHNFSGDGPPLIFETMIFGGPLDESCWRYATEREARAGHEAARLIAAQSTTRRQPQ